MKQIIWIALLVLGVSACGSSKDEPAAPERPIHEYFVWADPGIASGNFDADYADCQAQAAKDPALGESPPKLARVAAYVQCMQPKGWKFVNPDAPAGQ